MEIPQDYIDYIATSNKIDLEGLAKNYEPELSKCELIPVDELEIVSVKVHSECLQADMFLSSKDAGYFTIRYIPLLNHGEALVYYPDLKCYGQAGNSDHCFFFVLRGKKLSDITANTSKLLVGYFEWDEGGEYMMSSEDLKSFPFEAGPSDDGWFITQE